MEKQDKFNQYSIQILKNKLLYLYGIFNNTDFLFYDPDIVNAITSSAKLTIKKILRDLKSKLDNYDFIQSAADSVIFSSYCKIEDVCKILESVVSEIENITGIKDKLEFSIKEYDYCVSLATNNYCFIKDKKVVVMKGFPKLDFFQKAFKLLVLKCIENRQSENLESEKKALFEKFKLLPLEEVSEYFNVGKLEKQNDASKASLVYNILVEKLNLNVPFIEDNEKVKILYLENNRTIAFKNYLPDEIKNVIKIDWQKQFDVLFKKHLEDLNNTFNTILE